MVRSKGQDLQQAPDLGIWMAVKLLQLLAYAAEVGR